MKTDVITVSTRGNQIDVVLKQVEKVAAYKELSPKNTLHLRLLTEEMMGMMRSISGEMEGRFWIEEQNGVYELHLRTDTRMTTAQREKLLSASATGKNEAAKGLMGRLRAFFDYSADDDVAFVSNPLMLPDMSDYCTTPMLDLEWSLERYVAQGRACGFTSEEQKEAWDELEKSVVAHVADDVKVSIRGSITEMVIVKKLA